MKKASLAQLMNEECIDEWTDMCLKRDSLNMKRFFMRESNPWAEIVPYSSPSL